MNYYESIPNNPKENMPLIIFLHGDGEVANFARLRNISIVKKIENGELQKDKYFFIAPNAPQVQWYNSQKNYTTLKELIDYVVSEYKIDKKRIYINGFSGGACGTWTMVRNNPNFFAAAVIVSGCSGNIDNSPNTSLYTIYGTRGAETGYQGCMDSAYNSFSGTKKHKTLEGLDHIGVQSNYPTDEVIGWMLAQ